MESMPNLFRHATKELSQDAFFTWLIQWSDPTYKEQHASLHSCSIALLKLLVGNQYEIDEAKLDSVEAGRQWKNVDVWVDIYFTDDTKLFLIIEDKTFTGEHSKQLETYKAEAEKRCSVDGFNLACAYVKTGSETRKTLDIIRNKGFHVVERKELIQTIIPYKQLGNNILSDFVDYLEELQHQHDSFEFLPVKDWHWFSWVGFFQFIESQRTINMWHRVNNQAGGFWNLSLNWEYWNDIPLYMQIEERKICFKIAANEIETNIDTSQTNVSSIQDLVLKKLLEYASDRSELRIKRPYPYVHRGAYRTFAVVYQDDWLKTNDNIIDKEKTLDSLNSLIDVFSGFIDAIDKISYEDAGVSVVLFDNN